MLRNLSIVSGITLLNSVFPFVLLPIFTNYVTVADYGKLVILEAFLAIFTTIVHFGIAGLVVEIFKLKKDEFRKYASTSILILVPTLVLLEVYVFFSADFLSQAFGLDKSWLLLLPLIVFLNALIQSAVSIYQCEKNYRNYAVFLFLPNLLTFAIALTLLFYFDQGWQSKLYGVLISFFCVCALSLYYLIKDKYLSIEFCKNSLVLNLKFTLPLLPHSLAAGLYFMADRLFLANLLDSRSVAIYAAGLQLAMVMSVIQNALSKAWVPYVLEFLGRCKEDISSVDKAYRELLKYMGAGMLVLVILSAVISVFVYLAVMYLLPVEYSHSIIVGILVVSAFCILGFYKIISPVIWFYKKSAALS
ncbi:MAG: oligosaccharide flippase family protein, partial [Kangiellaceae bacterium]|nr:oligosaccharide flippase family protein [Kangiellaceae bacterium]